MSNLNFLNTNNCDDVSVNTPTKDLTFVDYILKNKVKDFSNIRKYVVSYSTNCQNELSVDVPPNYQFKIVSVSCTNNSGLNSYVIRLEGIHGDLVNQILYSTAPPLAGSGIGFTNTNGVITITLVYSDSLNPLPACQFTVIHVDGFEYVITFTLNQSPPTTCSWDGNVAGFGVTYNLPSNIGQPLYGSTFATTGVVSSLTGTWTTSVGFGETVQITADNAGIGGNSVALAAGDGGSLLSSIISNWNTANPTNTVTLTETNGTGYIPGVGETFTLTGGTAPTIPANLQLSLNTLYSLPVLYPALYGVKICEQTIIPSGATVVNGGTLSNNNPSTTQICFEDSKFVDCQTASCVETEECDSTETLCNLTGEVVEQYQSIIYGLDCCDESKQKILKHYIRIICPTELKC